MWSCFRIPKEEISQEQRFLLANGARILEEQITSCIGKCNPIRIFSAEELERATNNYDQRQIMFKYRSCTLYKGIHEDRVVSVKKFVDRYSQLCINEVVIASQMNHKNVLKLMGCCLETKIPVLVYEFVGNRDLSHHIFRCDSEDNPLLSWEHRLRIAMEVADVVTYLHTGTSKSIIHRNINTCSIILDQHNVAKLSDFRLSISIPWGETHVEAGLAGTVGFIAPESLTSGRYTEKSDVYGFGVVLLEILSGKTADDIFYEASVIYRFGKSKDTSTSTGRSGLVEDDKGKVIELYSKANILKGNKKQLMACTELALKCIKQNPEERPTMKEVAQELRRIIRLHEKD